MDFWITLGPNFIFWNFFNCINLNIPVNMNMMFFITIILLDLLLLLFCFLSSILKWFIKSRLSLKNTNSFRSDLILLIHFINFIINNIYAPISTFIQFWFLWILRCRKYGSKNYYLSNIKLGMIHNLAKGNQVFAYDANPNWTKGITSENIKASSNV